jgi:putative oxidoreductase
MPETPFEGVESARNFRTLVLGRALQRLFSTFPDRWPGFGLLLMRAGVGFALVYLGTMSLLEEVRAPLTLTEDVIAVTAGIFLLAGLWTPVMGALAALDQIWLAVSLPASHPAAGELIHIFLAVLCAGVAMLGPGAWSIDARLFGRRRFPSQRARGR